MWGRLVRWSEPVCRSIPTSQRFTISTMNRFAIRAASDPFGRPGERPIEVAAVGEVPVAVQESVDVHDGDGDERSGHGAGIEATGDSTDDLHAGDLVAVYGGTDPDGSARPAAVHDLDREGRSACR